MIKNLFGTFFFEVLKDTAVKQEPNLTKIGCNRELLLHELCVKIKSRYKKNPYSLFNEKNRFRYDHLYGFYVVFGMQKVKT